MVYIHMAVGQNQWYRFGLGAPPISTFFSGDWDVHWGYDLDFDPHPYSQVQQFPLGICLQVQLIPLEQLGRPRIDAAWMYWTAGLGLWLPKVSAGGFVPHFLEEPFSFVRNSEFG